MLSLRLGPPRGLSPGLLTSQALSPGVVRAGVAGEGLGGAMLPPSADMRTAAISSRTAGRVSVAHAASVPTASTQTAALMRSPAATIKRTNAATPTAAKDWCGLLCP
jgi:hypothetical protein